MIAVAVQNTSFIVFARKDSYFISYMCIFVGGGLCTCVQVPLEIRRRHGIPRMKL